MNYPLLKTELDKPEYAALSDVAAADLLNEPVTLKWREVPKPDIENYVRNSGISGKLSLFLTTTDIAIANNQVNPQTPEGGARLQLYVAAKEVKALFSGSIAYINGQNVSIQAAVGGFVQAGIFTQSEADAFFAQFQYRESRAQEMLGEPVTVTDIAIARNQNAINEAALTQNCVETAIGNLRALVQAPLIALQQGHSAELLTNTQIVQRFAALLSEAGGND